MVEILNLEINNYWDVPFVGKWPLKVGKVARLWSNPCTPDPEIWVYAFWHEVPFLVWSFIKPETVDMVLDRFGVDHHRKRRKKFRVKDVYQPKYPVRKGTWGWAVFPVVEAIQRVGFYLLVVDAGLDFAINWMSTAYQWTGCAVEDARWCRGKATGGVITFAHEFEGKLPIWTERTDHGFGQGVAEAVVGPGYNVSHSAAITYTTAPEGDSRRLIATFEIRDFENEIIYPMGEPIQTDDNTFSVVSTTRDWSATLPPHEYGVWIKVLSGRDANFNGSSTETYGDKKKGMKWDP